MVLPATARAVRAALASGRPHVTEGIRLVQETGEQRGVVMYQAAFRPSQDGHGAKPVRGVVSAVFRMDDVLAAALELAEFCCDSAGVETELASQIATACGNQCFAFINSPPLSPV